jgi:hypothetical protein
MRWPTAVTNATSSQHTAQHSSQRADQQANDIISFLNIEMNNKTNI